MDKKKLITYKKLLGILSSQRQKDRSSSSNLIFDVGFHKCEDLDFYLSQGYNVVGIDASLQNVEEATIRYRNQIKSGQLVLEHCAITKPGENVVDFYLSDNSVWSSLNKKIAARRKLSYKIGWCLKLVDLQFNNIET